MKKKGWLENQIEQAREEIDSWPEWMTASSTFEGSKREDAIPEKRQPISDEKLSKKLDT